MSSEPALLDPEVAGRVAALSFRAQKAVDGLLSGLHKSPHRGASVIFVEHREYRAGDDLRLLDWRAFARTDKHRVKRFEQESQLRATLVLDRSPSMGFGGSPSRPTKLEQGATLLGALAHVLLGQGDAAGMMGISEGVDLRVPPSKRGTQLETLMRYLARPAAKSGRTDLTRALMEVTELSGRRGLIAIASDLLDEREDALDPIAHLVSRGHDVLVFHVLDPAELELSFDGPARFEGLEGEQSVDADPELLHDAYQEALERFLERCRDACAAAGARYVLARTDRPPAELLAEVLRSGRSGGWG